MNYYLPVIPAVPRSYSASSFYPEFMTTANGGINDGKEPLQKVSRSPFSAETLKRRACRTGA